MPLPVIADVIRSACEGHCSNGHKWAMVLHHRKTPMLSNTGAIAILDPLLFAFFNAALSGGTAYKAFMPTSAGLEALVYTPLDGVTATTVNSHILAGTNSTEPLPASTALVATLRTAKRGRSYRGRTYLPQLTEGTNDAPGVPNTGNVAAIITQWAGYLTSLAGSGISLVVASYKHSTAEDVTTITVDQRWDTQRRRLNA